jgi:hypothetical protein
MALPILPLLILGGAAVVMLASSKSSSSSGSSSITKVSESYADDSAYVCVAIDPNIRDTLSSITSRIESFKSEFTANVDPMVRQSKVQTVVQAYMWTKDSAAAAVVCSSLAKSLAGVSGTAAFVQVVNLSNAPAGQGELCAALDAQSKAFGGPGFSQQDCSKLTNPNYAGIGAVVTTDLKALLLGKPSVSAQNVFILADGTEE